MPFVLVIGMTLRDLHNQIDKHASDLIAPTMGDQSHGGNAELITAVEERNMLEEGVQGPGHQTAADQAGTVAVTTQKLAFVCSGCGQEKCAGCPTATQRVTPADYFWKAGEARKPSVAVDLDGTLAKDLPDFDPAKVGDPRPGAKKWMEQLRATGAAIIIYTCRGDKDVVAAWLKKHDIPYDHINENPEQPPNTSDKLYADVYFDNRAVNAEAPLHKVMPEVISRVEKGASSPFGDLWTGLGNPVGIDTGTPLWQASLGNQLKHPVWNQDASVSQNVLTNLGQAHGRMRRAVQEHDSSEDVRTALEPGYGFRRLRRFLREGDAVQDPVDRLLTRGYF